MLDPGPPGSPHTGLAVQHQPHLALRPAVPQVPPARQTDRGQRHHLLRHLPHPPQRLHLQLPLPPPGGVAAAPALPGPPLSRRPHLGALPPRALRPRQLSESDQTVSGSRTDLGPRVVSQPPPRSLCSHLPPSRRPGRRCRSLQGKYEFSSLLSKQIK